MTPAEAAIWAAAYGAAFAAEVREHERASDENDPIERTLNGCAHVSVARCVRIADAAVERMRLDARGALAALNAAR